MPARWATWWTEPTGSFPTRRIARFARTYHAWRGEKEAGKYEDVPSFCKSDATEEIAAHGYILTPDRYVGAEAVEDEDEPFEEKRKRLVAKLEEQIRANLKGLGYGR